MTLFFFLLYLFIVLLKKKKKIYVVSLLLGRLFHKTVLKPGPLLGDRERKPDWAHFWLSQNWTSPLSFRRSKNWTGVIVYCPPRQYSLRHRIHFWLSENWTESTFYSGAKTGPGPSDDEAPLYVYAYQRSNNYNYKCMIPLRSHSQPSCSSLSVGV